MRPVSLELNAFGPYAGSQRISFAALDGEDVFLITGDTGAGKTTIFDAIAFALYGSASGEGRSPQSFKSHHAHESDVCGVTFGFSLRGELYSVSRSPRQSVPKADGSSREIGEKAELTLPGGAVISGSRAVDAKISEIIGLDYRQFKQTMMLAQGEFARLIQSNSTDKQEIFSRIFNTGVFGRLTAALLAEEAAARVVLEREQETVNRVVNELVRLGHTALDGEGARFLPGGKLAELVIEGIGLARERQQGLSEEIAALESRREGMDIAGKRAMNQKLERQSQLSQVLEGLEREAPEMERRRERLSRLRAAAELSAQQKMLLDTRQIERDARKRLDALQSAVAEQRDVCERAREKEPLIALLAGEIESARQQSVELLRREETAVSQRQRRARLEEARGRERRAIEALSALERQGARKERRERMKSIRGLLEDAGKHDASLGKSRAALEEARIAGERYDRLLSDFLECQAALLAGSLEPGQPCPVCGSAEHPRPAAGDSGSTGQNDLDEARRAAMNADEVCRRAALSEGQLRERVALKAAALGLSGEDAIIRARDILSELEAADAGEGDIEGETIPADVLEARGEAIKRELAALREGIAADAAVLDASGGAEDPEKLRAKRDALNLDAKEKQCLRDNIIDSISKSGSGLEALLAEERACREGLNAAAGRIEELDAAFRGRLAERGFASYRDYEALLPEVSEIPALERESELYLRALTETGAQLRQLREETRGCEKADLAALEERFEALGRELAEKRAELAGLAADEKASRRCLDELAAVAERTEKLRERYGALLELSTLAKGGRAPNISFERYVLVSYFEEIIQLANVYLARMTDSRFRLRRRTRQISRTAGLDLEVLDNHTGTCRDVSTLSGGEGFKASLALALGLSDVVQIHAGGISLGAIFVDEGFGTLDERSLESAVSTLVSLRRQGRMVGIISHVKELRDHIPTQLEVKQSPSGSVVSWR